MNILYGVQATGNGHICRSQEVINALKALGHQVRVLFSGRQGAFLPQMEGFEPFETFRGLTFVTLRGKVRLFKTAVQLNLYRFYKDIHCYTANGIDLIISDYEPISARIARRKGIPSIGIGHQYAFLHNIPITATNPATYWIMNHFAPVDHPVGLHWHHFGHPILPPIVSAGLTPDEKSIETKILVYLPFEHPQDIRRLLQGFSTHQFYIYATLHQPVDEGHLRWRPFCRWGFLNDLKDCSGVISNAGFELASEALQLGKKILVKPLAGQMEQASNALAMRKLDIGRVMNRLDRRQLADWLPMPSKPSIGYPDTARLLALWVESGRWEDIEGLARLAWAAVDRLPPAFHRH
jgi:uncharacterized protein (TIGR00661 family)